ncbi:MAG: hypothetical protein Ct9H300mP10_04560 [Methanobacteriota archaeon]|nr:MAG: hypothetical protein Ct9H300mP10_04560 [Euryarchaeota archaeon]
MRITQEMSLRESRWNSSQKMAGNDSPRFTDLQEKSVGKVAPGNWNLELNMTEDRVRWIVVSSNETSFEASAGGNPSLNLTASRMVEFGGNVYWDFDDDNASDVGRVWSTSP